MNDEHCQDEEDDSLEPNCVVVIVHGLGPSLVFEQNNDMNDGLVQVFEIHYIGFSICNVNHIG